MATPDEIRHRVEQADTARSAKRAATAQQVGKLAQRRATIAEQLEDIERQLGETLAAADDVIGIDELAQFTDVKATDLTRWFTSRKTTRAKRKKPTVDTTDRQRNTGQEPSTSDIPIASQPPST